MSIITDVTVRVILASSIDGKIADKNGKWQPICPYDEKRFYRALAWADSIVVGWKTVEDSGLSFVLKDKKLTKTLIDPHGRLDLNHRFFDDDSSIVVFGYEESFPRKHIHELMKRRIEVVLSKKYPIDPQLILLHLKNKYNSSKILIVGGGTTTWYFVEKLPKVELQLTITPIILGDSPFQNIRAPSLMFPGLRLKLVSARLCKCRQEVICLYRKE